MARSNSSQDRTAAQPTYPPARGSAPVEHGLPWNAAGSQAASYPQDPQFAAPAYDPQPTGRPHPGPTGQLPWPQQGAPAAGQPNAYPPQYQALPPPQANGSGGPYAQQPGYPQHAYPPQQPFPADPHRGHYFPQQQPDPAAAYQTPAPPYQDPTQQLRGTYPGHVEQGYAAPAQQMGGYPPAGYQNGPPNTVGHDPRGYEFGAYATAPVAYVDPHTGRPHQPTQPGQPHYDPHAQAHAAEAFDDDEEEFDDEDEDAPRRFGLIKILASLTIAIGIGAGGAYGYKKFGATPVAGNRPMAVRADAAPSKQRSAEANIAANADSKSANGWASRCRLSCRPTTAVAITGHRLVRAASKPLRSRRPARKPRSRRRRCDRRSVFPDWHWMACRWGKAHRRPHRRRCRL